MQSEQTFHSAREAKEFLVTRIVEEAQHKGIGLSEVERKMLYFSETDWTLPDIDTVSSEFDRDDQDDYEVKISGLVRGAYKRSLRDSGDGYSKWWAAIRLLSKQDHYILVMIRQAGLRPRGDQLKLFGAGLGIVVLIICLEFLWLFVSSRNQIDSQNYLPSRENAGFLIWAAAMGLAIATSVLYYASRTRVIGGVLDRFFKRFDRTRNKKN
jgi:hypothetical protein